MIFDKYAVCMHTALMPMKRITFTASEDLYRQLSLQSNLMKKSTSELIRECVEEKMAEKRQAAMLTQKKAIAGLINWSKQFLKENPKITKAIEEKVMVKEEKE